MDGVGVKAVCEARLCAKQVCVRDKAAAARLATCEGGSGCTGHLIDSKPKFLGV